MPLSFASLIIVLRPSVAKIKKNGKSESPCLTPLSKQNSSVEGTENYQVWSCAMLLALEDKNKIGFIDGTCRRLNAIWKQFDALIELPRCTCHADDDFKKHNQLMKSAYAIIPSEESHRVASGSIFRTSQRPSDNENRRTAGGSNLGPNGASSDDERSVKHEDDQNNIISEGDESLIHPQDDIHQIFKILKILEDLLELLFFQETLMIMLLSLNVEPKSFLEASKHQPWVDAMNLEIDALYRNNTWELADLPKGRKVIGSKCLMNLVVQSGLTLYQMDVNNDFLYGDLNETMHIYLPPSYFPANETKDDDPLLDNITEYQKLIGKLIYLTTTRPDIAYIVSCLSQFMHSPLKSHLKTTLKVIRLGKMY
ncbi:ribonuclease H-like domain-containing protein [Tanacetum coccineum]